MSDRERTTLRVALALTSVALLIVLYLAWPLTNDKDRWWALGWNLIPNALEVARWWEKELAGLERDSMVRL